ncbi:MAG: hypothetical protein R2838_02265 [Caldilineaceae bacterium]
MALPLLLLLAAPVRAQTPPFFEETDCAMVADLAAWRDDDLRCIRGRARAAAGRDRPGRGE